MKVVCRPCIEGFKRSPEPMNSCRNCASYIRPEVMELNGLFLSKRIAPAEN